MAFGGATSMFQVLGYVGVDSKAAEAALQRITASATLMATSAEKMAGAAEKAFGRYNNSAKDTTKTTLDLGKALETLAAAEFFNKMKEFTGQMLGAAQSMQQFQRTLTGVTGTAEKAADVLQKVSKYADRTPIDTEDIKRAATLFASMKQPIMENVDLSAKLAYLFNVDLPRASLTVAEANAGVVHSMRRLAVEFAFTASMAQKYGAIVEHGHVVIGKPGSEANKRLMDALRGFVHDREKGLGGDLFGGAPKLDVAFSNLKSGLFLAFASLGQTVTPTVVAVSQALRGMLDAVRALPTPLQSLLAHLALFLGAIGALTPALVVLFGFFKAWGMVKELAGAINMLAAANYGAAGSATLLSASFGPLMAAFAVATLAIALYQSHLEAVDKKTLEAAKNLSEYHKLQQSINTHLKESGLSETTATVADLRRIKPGMGKSVSEWEKLESFAAAKEERLESLYSDQRTIKPEDRAEADKLKTEADKYRRASLRFLQAGLLEGIKDVYNQVTGKTKKEAPEAAPPPEYHEIMAQANLDQQLASTNMLGSGARDYVKGRLEKQVSQSEARLKLDRRDQVGQLAMEQFGENTHEGRAKILETDAGKDIMSGKRDDPEQWKAYIELRKRLNDVRKEGLDIDQQERDHALKLSEIQHKDSPEARIKAIDDELAAYTEAYKNRAISEEDYDSKVRESEIKKAEQVQKQKDAQRDMNQELAKLYGDDFKAADIEVQKKVEAWKVAGVEAVDIEKMKNAELLSARTAASVKEIELEQRIADEKAGIRSRVAGTKEAVLQERRGQGEDVGAELRSTRSAEASAQTADVDSKTSRRRKVLKAQIKAATDPAKKKELEAQLANLDEAAKAEKDSINQSADSRNRSEEREQAKREGEAVIGGEKVQVGRLGYRNQVLKEKLEQPGADTTAIGKRMIDNVAKEYELNKQILEQKERIDEVGKSEVEKQNLRNQLQLDLLKLQNDSLKAAQDITAEIEKQNQLNKKSGDFTLGGTYGSYADAMAADKADSDQMAAKYHSGGKKTALASRLGISEAARQTPTFVDAKAAKASAEDVTFPGGHTGMEKTHARWEAINQAGASADKKGRPVLVSGKAELHIKVQNQDGSVSDGGKAEIPLERAASEGEQHNPLGGR